MPSESRTVLLEGGRPTPGFGHNGIKTAKYNPVTFAPIFLFEMFSRAAYLYFLIQVRPSPRAEPHAEPPLSPATSAPACQSTSNMLHSTALWVLLSCPHSLRYSQDRAA